jgi:16S rRNA (adenine1518-N6/adenine1519-N6)-dimethyltransferase
LGHKNGYYWLIWKFTDDAKEVAQRLCADIGEMSLLSAATQVWAKPKLLLTLKPSDFEPQPAVHSAVIELTTRNKQLTTDELIGYYKALHIIFKQPRKMLVNNLIDGGLARNEALALIEKLGLPATARAQDLATTQCLTISRAFPL